MQAVWTDALAPYAPYLLLFGAALLLVAGVLLWTRRHGRLGSRTQAAHAALRAKTQAHNEAASFRRERQVAEKAPDTGPQDRSTQVGTNSISEVMDRKPAAPAPATRPVADTRALTVSLDPQALTELTPEGLAQALREGPEEATELNVPLPRPTETTQVSPGGEAEPELTVLTPVPEAPAPVAAGPESTEQPRVDPAAATDAAALAGGLEKTRAGLWGRLRGLFGQKQQVDAELLETCEDILLTSDVGVGMTDVLLDALKAAVAASPGGLDADGVRTLLRRELGAVLAASQAPLNLDGAPVAGKPRVVLFVGVNGVGKTTTIGKVAHLLGGRGQKVVLAAGDTYRAAAAEQLTIWGERTGARVVRGAEGADPASVMFNAVEAAKACDADVVLADTAGRLHTQNDLMDEIRKVGRALAKLRPGAPDETWLVVDATTGQNALHQARAFHETLGLTGLVLTKLDGTAKGGVVFAIAHELKLPVRFVGLGEKAESLQAFDANAFVEALFAQEN